MRHHELASRLQRIPSHPRPQVTLEQYTIPSDLAARIIFEACYHHDDIEGKNVVDLGTGTGRLAMGAAMLGASYVVGVDIDKASLKIAATYSLTLGLSVDWVLADIAIVRGPMDTALMNPPFGTKREHSDLRFLETALACASVVYTIHKSTTRDFLKRWLEERARKIDILAQGKLMIPQQFTFHRKKRHFIDVDVFRVVPK